jgi:hypothetical protein
MLRKDVDGKGSVAEEEISDWESQEASREVTLTVEDRSWFPVIDFRKAGTLCLA